MSKAIKSKIFQPTFLACLISSALLCMTHVVAAREYFNPALLEVDNQNMQDTDLSSFEEGSQAPGKYRVDIIINEQMVDTREIEFKAIKNSKGDETLEPCLSVALLQSYGIKTTLFPGLGEEGECANFAAIPNGSVNFLFGSQKLLLSIPQAALSPQARGYVSPELWDEGINAALLNYSFSGANTRMRQGNGNNSQYANLRPGINVGPWRVRNYTTWNRDTYGQNKWNAIYTYAQRNIVALNSQLVLGDSSSPADIFDSIPFRGGQLASDDQMLPDSLRGYAPVVRGIARSNAQVVIRQNGYVIYQSYVSPGAFEIADMFPTGGSGDLNVTVKEADGSEQSFVVPFASVPVLQREGRLKYSLTAGKYRSYNRRVDKTPLSQATAIYGLPHGFTAYGGIQGSSPYQSLAAGMGLNLGRIGALSSDVTQSFSTPKEKERVKGQSWRIRYSKNFNATGTNLAIAGYRYSTAGYFNMQEVLDTYGDDNTLPDRRRNRGEFTVNQTLGEKLGSITGSAIREDYWATGNTMASYGVSYSNSWKGISYGVNYTYSTNVNAKNTRGGKTYDNDHVIALNISIPLERFMKNTWASYGLNSSKQGSTTHSVSINGTALQDNALNWGVQQGYGSGDNNNTGNLNANFRGTYGEINGGYGYDNNSQRINYGLNGGVLVHSDSITLSQPLGETIALIKAPGAKGVGVTNQAGVKTDFRGYTVTSNLSPYRKNDIALDTATLPDDVELQLTTKTVVPTRGAVVRAEYAASVGQRVLMTLTQSNGEVVPFGAMVSVKGSDSQGFIVGDAGQVYLTGLESKGELTVKWGQSSNQLCQLNYSLKSSSTGLMTQTEQCV